MGENSAMDDAVCIVNIGPKGRQMRARFGMVSTAVGVLVAGACWWFVPNPFWRGLAFLPFFAGALGFFQAAEKT
jgi:hypothetical protein